MNDSSLEQDDFKEIFPGTWLHKINENENGNSYIVWKIEVKIMNVIEMYIDLTESKHINTYNKEKKITIHLNPFEIKEIARSDMNYKPVFKAHFDIKLLVPSKDIQKHFIEKDIISNKQIMNDCKAFFTNNNFELISIKKIEDALKSKNINKYIDFEFPPCEESYSEEAINYEYLIHWRRPQDFVLLTEAPPLFTQTECNIINKDDPEPNDVHLENLPDYELATALSGISEKHKMVSRLIINEKISSYGIYLIQLWLNGQRKVIIIDDLFPCYPMGNPIVTRSPSNEIWVLLLEKAVAKLLGNYLRIKNLSLSECLLLVTGCPTFCYNIENENTSMEYRNDFLNKLNLYVEQKKYLSIAVNCSPEEEENEKKFTVPGLGYSILEIVKRNKYTFVKLRRVWNDQNEQHVDQNIDNYHEKYKSVLSGYGYDYEQEIHEGKMFLLIEDFLKEFNELNVCYTQSWEEIRLRGEFIFAKYDNNKNTNFNEQCISKWYYVLTLDTPSQVIISLFQDEDKIKETDSRKPIIDISLSVLKYNTTTSELYHIQTLDFVHSPCLQMELELDEGTYIIYPRSTGFFFGKPSHITTSTSSPLYNKQTKSLTPLFANIIRDIFKKFDINLVNVLKYDNFSSLYYKCTKTKLNTSEFNNIVNSYSNYNKGLTERGLIHFFTNEYEEKGENVIREWLSNLGYTNDLYCNMSRCFMLTIHSNTSVNVNMKNSLGCDIHFIVNKILLKNFGKKFLNRKQGDITPMMFRSNLNGVVTLGCENKSNTDLYVKLNIEENESIIYKNKYPIERLVKGNDCEFFCFVFDYIGEEYQNINVNFSSRSFYSNL